MSGRGRKNKNKNKKAKRSRSTTKNQVENKHLTKYHFQNGTKGVALKLEEIFGELIYNINETQTMKNYPAKARKTKHLSDVIDAVRNTIDVLMDEDKLKLTLFPPKQHRPIGGDLPGKVIERYRRGEADVNPGDEEVPEDIKKRAENDWSSEDEKSNDDIIMNDQNIGSRRSESVPPPERKSTSPTATPPTAKTPTGRRQTINITKLSAFKEREENLERQKKEQKEEEEKDNLIILSPKRDKKALTKNPDRTKLVLTLRTKQTDKQNPNIDKSYTKEHKQ